ncbi:uncharacterized protein C12orf40 homolog isoform X2 [Hemicordylus capensis]|uniref:uncharacterized protein C12orf40 homolog isoform X2 n=1 Tax=Hemicordylus capensis TaxID=884348 RepID=UPI00230432C5|nr:uncharacterized protein C12orf40 homolog isoform X2 [Hemicordylus capensis]
MNWVGGSRKRIMLTKERRKQKDFFEKERLKSKMKMLRVSPLKSSTVSLDLLNLYVVNQMSTKKDYPDKVQKPVHVDIDKGIKIPLRRHNVELPKSPEERSSKISLDDIQNRLQQEVLENRTKYLLGKKNIQSQCRPSQPEIIKCDDPWLPKTSHRQRNFSDPGVTAPAGLHFQQLNSSEYSNSFDKHPKITVGTDFGDQSKGGPLFSVVNDREILKATQGESTQPWAALFEEENQCFPTHSSSELYCSFTDKNIMEELFTDPGVANQISNVGGPYVKDMHQRASFAQSCPAERSLQGIFTAPEQIFSKHTKSLSANSQELIKNQLKDYCIQERNPVIFSEQQENTADFNSAAIPGGRSSEFHTQTTSLNCRGFINQTRNIKVAETMQNYFKEDRNGTLAEPSLNHLKIFGLEEVHDASFTSLQNKTENEVSSYYDHSSEPDRQQDDTSQLSSQSPGYSREQAGIYARTTSDESKEEDQNGNMPCYFEDSFPRNYDNRFTVSGSQRPCNCQSMDVSSILLDSMTKERAGIHPQIKSAMDIRKVNAAPSLHSKAHIPFKNKQYANFNAKHNAWSQTEKCAEEIQKSNAAIQCDIMQACRCKSELSSLCSAEIVTSTSKVETTGGQNIPVNGAAFQPLSNSSAMFVKTLPSDTEYLTEQGKTSRGMLNCLNVKDKGETCN